MTTPNNHDEQRYTIAFRLDIDLPEPIAQSLTMRCADTGESPSDLAAKAIAHYLAGGAECGIDFTKAMDLSLEQQFDRRKFNDQVSNMSNEQKSELLELAYHTIAVRDNMLRQLLSHQVKGDRAFTFGRIGL